MLRGQCPAAPSASSPPRETHPPTSPSWTCTVSLYLHVPPRQAIDKLSTIHTPPREESTTTPTAISRPRGIPPGLEGADPSARPRAHEKLQRDSRMHNRVDWPSSSADHLHPKGGPTVKCHGEMSRSPTQPRPSLSHAVSPPSRPMTELIIQERRRLMRRRTSR